MGANEIMQSDVPPLPIAYLTSNTRLRRNSNLKLDLASQDNTNILHCKSSHSALLSSKKKKLCSLTADTSPYENSARFNVTNIDKCKDKSIIRQRVSSAKMLRIKQLQNQLADVHFHLNELSKENKLLKEIQKRQDTALKRYEGTNAELPRIMHAHHEDLRVLQSKFKKLKTQHRETNDALKDKQNELHSLQVQNKKLLQLSKDRQLGERNKLQAQVLDLCHKINQQDEMIQTLKRKLSIESKYLKHQLYTEINKHKETQKKLQSTLFKLKGLEELTEQREKKSYQSSRSAFCSKDRSTATSQSLTNLNENISNNLSKEQSLRTRRRETITEQSLPDVNGKLFSQDEFQENKKFNKEASSFTKGAQINFDQIPINTNKKSPKLHRSTKFSISKNTHRELPIKEFHLEKSDIKKHQEESKVSLENFTTIRELPKTLKEEFHCATHDGRYKDDNLKSNVFDLNESFNLTNSSRQLHARLINTDNNGKHEIKTLIADRSLSLSKENLSDIIENDQESTQRHDSIIIVKSKDMLKDEDSNIYNSNSDFESEMEMPIELNIDEDESRIRKMDINVGNLELEKQKIASCNLCEHFVSNPLDYGKDNDIPKLNLNFHKDEVESDRINKSLIHSGHINGWKPTDIVTPFDNNYTNRCPEVRERKLDFDRSICTNRELNLKVREKMLPTEQNSQKFSKNINCNLSGEKMERNNLQEFDSEIKTELKTVENLKMFDKAKLLAAMKAIDDNENIEFIDQKVGKNSVKPFQIPENLCRGIPSHLRKKSDIMKEFFTDTKLDNKNIEKY